MHNSLLFVLECLDWYQMYTCVKFYSKILHNSKMVKEYVSVAFLLEVSVFYDVYDVIFLQLCCLSIFLASLFIQLLYYPNVLEENFSWLQ